MLKILKSKSEKFTEIIVSGEVDASSSIHLDKALEESLEAKISVIINLTDMTYISSAGLGVFIARLEEVKDSNNKMILFGLNEKVKNVFDILGLSNLLSIKNDKNEAIESID